MSTDASLPQPLQLWAGPCVCVCERERGRDNHTRDPSLQVSHYYYPSAVRVPTRAAVGLCPGCSEEILCGFSSLLAPVSVQLGEMGLGSHSPTVVLSHYANRENSFPTEDSRAHSGLPVFTALWASMRLWFIYPHVLIVSALMDFQK